MIVAKTPSSAKKAQSYAERLRLGIAVIHGEPQDFDSDREDGRHSPPPVSVATPDGGGNAKQQSWALAAGLRIVFIFLYFVLVKFLFKFFVLNIH